MAITKGGKLEKEAERLEAEGKHMDAARKFQEAYSAHLGLAGKLIVFAGIMVCISLVLQLIGALT
jgi:hypothetical protein